MNKIIVIIGPTGAGKTTTAEYLKNKFQVEQIITHTTRPKRKNEKEGIDYYFETKDSFPKNHFLEQVTYSNYQYGSSKEGIERAYQKSPIVSIVLDTKGAETYVKELGNEVQVLYLKVKDEATIKQRLLKRGDSLSSIESRLKTPEYKRDLVLPEALKPYTVIINNDDWTETQNKLNDFYEKLKAEIKKL